MICLNSLNLGAQVINRLLPVDKILEKRKNAIFKVSVFENGIPKSHGTGFFINSKGLALTNFHVLYHRKNLIQSNGYKYSNIDMNYLLKTSGFQYKFTNKDGIDLGNPVVIGCGNKNNIDACFIKFEKNKTPYIPIEDVKVGTGNKVFSIGHCGGKMNVKNGKIKEYHKDFLSKYDITDVKYNLSTKMIDISNPVCPGDSGGPIFSSNGNLVGMTTIRFSKKKRWWYLGIMIKEVESVKKDSKIKLSKYQHPSKGKVRRPADPFHIP
jgi:S1-C subfamily serine protease